MNVLRYSGCLLVVSQFSLLCFAQTDATIPVDESSSFWLWSAAVAILVSIFFFLRRSSDANLLNMNSTVTSSEKAETYANQFGETSSAQNRKANYKDVVKSYYDIATDMYEWGWGECFHFARRYNGESLLHSIHRHEHYLASALKMKPGMKVLDVGCGIGGPMREIARFTGSEIVGINLNPYQVKRAELKNKKAGLDKTCSLIQTDFMNIPLPNESVDAIYSIEATCHAPDRVALFKEMFRLLKEGAEFASYEWVMTSKYDPSNQDHKRIKHGIEIGDGLPDLETAEYVVKALKEAGFEVIQAVDLAPVDEVNAIPWYYEFKYPLSVQGLGLSPVGRMLAGYFVQILEAIKLAPAGSSKTHKILQTAAYCLLDGGEQGIFTPMFFIHARKPVTLQNHDPIQVKLMEEVCISVDDNDRVIGQGSKKECHLNVNIEKGLLHRAFSIFLFDSKGRLLLQQRAKCKITFPLHWTNTVCSHPLYIDSELEEKSQLGVLRAAQRKLEQELGVPPEQVPLEKFKFLTRLHYKARSDEIWGEHEIDYILLIQADVTLNPNPNEVEGYQYVSREELPALLDRYEREKQPITPWFRLVVSRFLYSWWEDLKNLDKKTPDMTIHRMLD